MNQEGCCCFSLFYSSLLSCCLTLVVSIQMHSILTSPTANLHQNIFQQHHFQPTSLLLICNILLLFCLSPPYWRFSSAKPRLLPFSHPLQLFFHQKPDFWLTERLGNTATVTALLYPPSGFLASVFILWQLVATFWPQKVHGSEYTSTHIHAPSLRWTNQLTLTHSDVYAQTKAHTNRNTCTTTMTPAVLPGPSLLEWVNSDGGATAADALRLTLTIIEVKAPYWPWSFTQVIAVTEVDEHFPDHGTADIALETAQEYWIRSGTKSYWNVA